MTLLTSLGRGRRRPGIDERLAALDEVVDLARDRVDPDLVRNAERIAAKAGDRLRFGAAHTVVALAGATGSGKSSLFNALTGESLAEVGLRRPTTAVARAAVRGPDPAGNLLDWLDVPARHLLPSGSGGLGGSTGSPAPAADLDGLVLLDLPDVDSVEHANRLVAERLVEQVDLLLWVLDPQKYADAAIHDRYLVPLAGHADVTLVVLNQIDRLSGAARQGCLDDLRRLLTTEGLGGVPVLGVSARTGEGLPALHAELTGRVAAKRASVRRLEADLASVSTMMDGGCAPSGVTGGGRGSAPGVGAAERGSLVRALGDAAGIDVVVSSVAASHRLRAGRVTGWPVTGWLSRFRLDPAKRLRLRDNPSELVRTSLPAPSAVQRARIDQALRDLSSAASEGLPEPWPTTVRRSATSARGRLPELLDRVVAGTDLGLARTPRWWRATFVLQMLLLLTAVAGLAWLAALFGIAWLQLPDPPLPHVGPLAVPTVMLAAGLAGGLLLGLLAAGLARVGARRAAARARRRLDERVDQLAVDAVLTPVEAELTARDRLCAALEIVRA